MGKTLQDYDDNPYLVPDEDDADRLIAELEARAEEGDPPATEAPEGEGEQEGQATTGQDAPGNPDETQQHTTGEKGGPGSDGQEKDGEPKPVVKTRDGKHEIPYSVLEAERRRARELQAELEEVRRQIKQAAPAAAASETPAETGEEQQAAKDHLQALIEEYGEDHEIVAAFRAERARTERYARDLDELKAWRDKQERSSQVAEAVSVEEAIDSVFSDTRKPGETSILRQWQQEGGPLWDAAVAVDVRLQNDPEHRHLPLTQRLEKVVEILGFKPNKPPAPNAGNAANLAETVERKLAEKDKAPLPRSLSDLPGGEFSDQSEHDALERMTPSQIQAKFDRMTPTEQEEFLARL